MTQQAQTKKSFWGWVLIASSFIVWGGIALLPFIDIPHRIILGTVMYICSYGLFFAGGFLLGQERMKQLKIAIYRFFGRNTEPPS